MRFFSSSALASAPKLRFAASCSAAETMARLSKSARPAAIWGSRGRFARLFRGRQDRHRAAGLFDRRDGGLRGTVDRKRDLRLQFAIAEKPHPVMGAAQQPRFDHSHSVDRRAGIELAGIDCGLHAAEVHLVQLELERLVEAALRQPPVQRHLTALETLDADARARRLALAAAAAGLALTRADAAPDARAVLARSGPVGDLVEFHCTVLVLSFVMAGLDPAIPVLLANPKTWMPGTRPGMTELVTCPRPRGRGAS